MPTKKSLLSFFVLAIFAITPFLFQNCASSHDDGSDAFSVAIPKGQCGSILINGFSTSGYYDFVKTNCGDCHAAGGVGAGYFASSNQGEAADHFIQKGEDKIANFATTNHKAGYTGPQHNEAIANLSSAWDNVQTNFEACKAQGGEGGENIGGGEVVVPAIYTNAKPYNTGVGNTITMSWTGAETGQAGANVNVTIEMDMEAFDLGGMVTGYYFTAPRIVNLGATPIYIQGVGVRLNGVMVSGGTTWYSLERHIPANGSRQLAPNGGAIIALSSIAADVLVEIAVGQLIVSPIGFAPVTFADLQAAGESFKSLVVLVTKAMAVVVLTSFTMTS